MSRYTNVLLFLFALILIALIGCSLFIIWLISI